MTPRIEVGPVQWGMRKSAHHVTVRQGGTMSATMHKREAYPNKRCHVLRGSLVTTRLQERRLALYRDVLHLGRQLLHDKLAEVRL